MKREKYSHKHHYLPVFYLKGFTDINEQFYVYDKIRDVILIKQNPNSKFYENDLNNYKFKGEILFTFEESLFSPQDTETSILFSRLQNTDPIEFTALEKFKILHFLSVLYWRLPESNNDFLEIIKKEGFSNKYFCFKNKQNEKVNDEDIPEVIEKILTDTELQKMYKHMIPFSNGSSEEILRLFDKWKIYSLTSTTPTFITGDKPFLINNQDKRLDNIFNELIFPLNKNKLLVLSDKSPDFLDGLFIANVNVSILEQSKRFIATHSEEQLKATIYNYKELKKVNQANNLNQCTFEFMHYQSQFKSHEEYYNIF